MSGKTVKMVRRQMKKAVAWKLRECWAALASLGLRDRVRLDWWLLIGRGELPQKGE